MKSYFMPCPFCHSLKLAVITDAEKMGTKLHPVYFVGCRDCFCQGPIGGNKHEAVNKWNTRKVTA